MSGFWMEMKTETTKRTLFLFKSFSLLSDFKSDDAQQPVILLGHFSKIQNWTKNEVEQKNSCKFKLVFRNYQVVLIENGGLGGSDTIWVILTKR
jgi:hypothetical protein